MEKKHKDYEEVNDLDYDMDLCLSCKHIKSVGEPFNCFECIGQQYYLNDEIECDEYEYLKGWENDRRRY